MITRCLFSLLLWACCAQALGQHKTLKVACIGNSVTYGAGIPDREHNSYPAQLQQLLGNSYEVGNFGHSGATLLKKGHNPYYKTAAFKAALSFRPDVAIIDLGLNDTDPRNWPAYRDDFAPDYHWLIDTLRRVNPAIRIFMGRLTPIFHTHARFRSGTRTWFRQIQELLPQIATSSGVQLIDLHTPLYNRPNLFPDAIHPNAAGAAIMARTVYAHVTGDFGRLQMPGVFASHMVMQRNKPLAFYGTAHAGAAVTVNFAGQTRAVKAAFNGRWRAEFPAMPAGGPYTAVVRQGEEKIELEDVLIGDVWLCSGQSNMAFMLRDALPMAKLKENPQLRLLLMQPLAATDNSTWDSLTQQKVNDLAYFSGHWATGINTAFSAVAYHFGARLQEQLQVPVGLVQVAVGGSETESWIDRYTMEHDDLLVNALFNWRKSDFIMPWCRERADINLGPEAAALQRHPYEPCYNFEAGIQPLTAFPIKGVIWYQGESNAHNAELHTVAFQQLVQSWRRQWGYAFPFYYVQLSSLNRPGWEYFRYSQLALLQQIPHTGMAVSSDVGDSTDVHPRRKAIVGLRLANLALHNTYGMKNIAAHTPLATKAERRREGVLVRFDDTLKGPAAKGFRLLTDKGRQIIVEAAAVKGQTVLLPYAGKEKIMEVLYGWAPYSDGNLYSAAGLPASTFRLRVTQGAQ